MLTWISGHPTLQNNCLCLEALCAWRISDLKDGRICFLCATPVNVSVIRWLMITGVQRSLIRCYALCPREQEAIPGVHPQSHYGSLEIFLPPDEGLKDHLYRASAAGTWPKWPKGTLTRGHAWCCRERSNNTQGPVPACPGGTLLSDPSAGHQLFPEPVSECLFPQVSHTSQDIPKPQSALPGPISGAPRVAKCPQSDLPWGKNTSCTWQSTSGCFKTLGPLATSLHPISWGCPWLFRWDVNDKLCFASPEGIPLVWLLLSR